MIQRINIRISGNLFELSKNIGSFRSLNDNSYKKIQKDYRDRILKAYDTQSSGGIRWKPNAPGYLKSKKRKRENGSYTYSSSRVPGIRTGRTRKEFLNNGISRKDNVINIGIDLDGSLEYTKYNLISKVTDSGRKLPIRDPLLNIMVRKKDELRRNVESLWTSFIRTEIAQFVRNPRRRRK